MACGMCNSPAVSYGLCGRCSYARVTQERLAQQQQAWFNQQQQMMRPVTYMVKPPFNHGVHLVIDLLTCGAWLPFHLLIWLFH